MPLPSVHVSVESRSSTAMSFYRSESALTPGTRFRAQTAESALKVKAQRIPFYTDAGNSTYVPASDKDPLDVEVAAIVNAIPHGLLIERVDPPLNATPKEGEEIRASYAFSNSLSKKVVTCKLTTLTRSGARGGWQDLQLYMINRQAGI
ncbi:hypothetical protein M405DRAFT_843698 [Rhizopogon salebrosus TDB-379]|nr:hypothetical protein M405DRAFT_843698 [Rhizopogon salebrosus TDB-379]